MKHLVLALLLACPTALWAETPKPAPEGMDLMEQGARLLFRGLIAEMEPKLEEMGQALSELEPALRTLMAQIDDIRNYEAPRILDNGDILIPRRKDAPPRPTEAPQIDL
jgi:hypothetical protein